MDKILNMAEEADEGENFFSEEELIFEEVIDEERSMINVPGEGPGQVPEHHGHGGNVIVGAVSGGMAYNQLADE